MAAMREAILIVDDDRQLRDMLADYLCGEGFTVAQAADGADGVEAVRAGGHDLVVLDITMPVMDGFEALRRLRKFSDVPVLMLTARGDELDRIVGLELGADDYLSKPFNPRELAARLRAILRRAHSSQAATAPAEVDGLRLDPGTRQLFKNDQPVAVTATEYAVMAVLMDAAGSLVDKDHLSREALGRELTPFDRSLDTHISNLRRKLGDGPDGQARIKTIRGRGYQLVVAAA